MATTGQTASRELKIEDIYPLSPLQQGILFHALYAPGSGVYVTQCYWELGGEVDVAALMSAWRYIIQRHSILRSAFVWEGRSKPLQVAYCNARLLWLEIDWRALREKDRDTCFRRLLDADRQRGFEISRAPLLRFHFCRFASGRWCLMLTFHHLILDGWSAAQAQSEVLRSYQALRQRQRPVLAAARPYRDFIAWLRRCDLAGAETFWKRQLAGFGEPNPLPFSRTVQMPARASPAAPALERHHKKTARMNAVTTAGLKQLAQRQRLTLSTLILGLWAVLLSYTSQRQDVLFGIVVMGRPESLEGVETMVGLFINTLPMRAQVIPGEHLLPWLEQLQERQAEMRELGYCSLAKIQGWLNRRQGSALFESLLVFDNYPRELEGAESRGQKIEIRSVGGHDQNSYPLTVTLAPQDELLIDLDAIDHYYDESGLDRLLDSFKTLLEAAVASPESKLVELQRALSAASRAAAVSARKPFFTTAPGVSRFASALHRSAELVRTERLELGLISLPCLVPAHRDADLKTWLESHPQQISQAIEQAGGVLLRGFMVASESELRQIAGRLCQPGPGERSVGLEELTDWLSHPESGPENGWHSLGASRSRWPLRVCLYCRSAPRTGAELSFADTREVLRHLDPDVLERFSRLGALYLERHPGDGELQTRRVWPAIRQHPLLGQSLWFNEVGRLLNVGQPGADPHAYDCRYGDGSTIASAEIASVLDAHRRSLRRLKLQPGDLLVFDNMLTAFDGTPAANGAELKLFAL